MTREEIITFINNTLATNSSAFCPEHKVIEDNYIYIPAVEFIRDADTGEWRAIS